MPKVWEINEYESTQLPIFVIPKAVTPTEYRNIPEIIKHQRDGCSDAHSNNWKRK